MTKYKSYNNNHLIILALRSQHGTEILSLRHVLIFLSVQPAVGGGPVDCYVGHPCSLVHSHWSRNVEARLSLVESFPSDAGASDAPRWFFMAEG